MAFLMTAGADKQLPNQPLDTIFIEQSDSTHVQTCMRLVHRNAAHMISQEMQASMVSQHGSTSTPVGQNRVPLYII